MLRIERERTRYNKETGKIERYKFKDIVRYEDLTKEQFRAFQRIIKNVTKTEKTKLPTSLKEYIKQYTGSKQFAKSDYVYEWVKELDKLYPRQTRKAKKRMESEGYSTERIREKFDIPANNSLNHMVKAFATYSGMSARRLSPEYYKTTFEDEELKKLERLKKRVPTITAEQRVDGEVTMKMDLPTRAMYQETSLKIANHSTIKLYWLNMQRACQEAGYYRLLKILQDMTDLSLFRRQTKIYSDIFGDMMIYYSTDTRNRPLEHDMIYLFDPQNRYGFLTEEELEEYKNDPDMNE